MHSGVSADNWPVISGLMDRALDLPEHERPQFVDSLDGEYEPYRETLRALLASVTSLDSSPFLQTLPRVATAGPSDDDAAEGALVGPYRLLTQIGHGGMGTVWIAERADGSFSRRVAIKLPRAVWGNLFADRMARERQILASLEHPNIARLYDAGLDARGRPYLAMEYVQGQSIDRYVAERQPTLAETLGLLLQICDAVTYAHARLVVHRDLKPSNILVNADGQVRLLDFGIAKLLERDSAPETALTQLGGRALTFGYASPEQIAGQPIGVASDVYSLGVLAYEIITGQRLFASEAPSESESQAGRRRNPPLPSRALRDDARRRTVRGDLDAIVLKALAFDVGDRYATVEQFATDLRRFLQQQPVTARRNSPAYRVAKLLERQWRAVSVIGLAVVAVLASFDKQTPAIVAMAAAAGFAFWQLSRAKAQREQAREQALRAEQVQRYLLKLIREGSYRDGSGAQATAIDLLAGAAARLDEQRIEDPAVALTLREAIGYSLIGAEEPALALRALDAVPVSHLTELGRRHPAVLRWRVTKALALLEAGQTEEARELFNDCVAAAREAGDAVAGARALAHLCFFTFEPEVKLSMAREAARLSLTIEGEDGDYWRALAHVAQANAVRSGGTVEEQLAASNDALAFALRAHGRKPKALVLQAMSLRGSALSAARRVDDAIAIFKEVIELQGQQLGQASVISVSTEGSLANCYLENGELILALQHFERVVELGNGIPASGPECASALRLIVYCRVEAGLDGCVAAADRALEETVRVHGADSPIAFSARSARIGALVHEGALTLAEQALQEQHGGSDAFPQLAVGRLLVTAQLRAAQGRLDEAWRLVQDMIERVRSTPALKIATARPLEAEALRLAGSIRLAQGDREAARPLLDKALELLSERHPRGSPLIDSVVHLLAQANGSAAPGG